MFVSGGAGSVGSLAGRLARALGGMRVIGSTGSPEKAERMLAELGYDAVVVRGAEPLAGRLAAAAPDGIDVLLDTVGGEDLRAAVTAARPGARFALVGALSGQLSPDGPGTTAAVERDSFQLVVKPAAAAGTTPRALRLYEQNGLLLPPPRRTATGQREYGPREIDRVRLIR